MSTGLDSRIFKLLIAASLCAIFGVVGVLLATVVSPNLQGQLNAGLSSGFVLASASSTAYPSWQSSDVAGSAPVYSTYWAYNLTNPTAFLAGAKPSLRELPGLPYLYHNLKYNVSWDPDDGDIVAFKEYQYYTPVDAATAELAQQPMTTVNLPLLAVLTNSIGAALVASNAVLAAKYLNDTSALLITRPVAEVLFGWENDPFLTDFNTQVGWTGFTMPTTVPGIQNNDSSLDYALATHSYIRMHTGVLAPSLMMQYESWDGSAEMACCEYGPCGDVGTGTFVTNPWNTDDANSIAGSAGAQFKLGVSCTDVLRVATYDFGIYRHFDLKCGHLQPSPAPGQEYASGGRISGAGGSDDGPNHGIDIDRRRRLAEAPGRQLGSNYLNSEGDAPLSTVPLGDDSVFGYTVLGVNLLRFTMPVNALDNATSNPVDGWVYNQFGPNGLINQSMCDGGAPIFLSKPRFLDGDPSLSAAIENMELPNSADHDTYLGVEPYTGSTMDFHWRVGVNAYVQPVAVQLSGGSSATFFPDVKALYFPLAWISQDSTVTPAQASQVQDQLYTPLMIIQAVYWGGIAFAAAAGGASVLLISMAVCRRRALSARLRPASGRRLTGGTIASGAGGVEGVEGDEGSDVFLLPDGGEDQVYREYVYASHGHSTGPRTHHARSASGTGYTVGSHSQAGNFGGLASPDGSVHREDRGDAEPGARRSLSLSSRGMPIQ